MDIQKLLDLIPAIFLLISFMTIILLVLKKFDDDFFNSSFKANNALIFIAPVLFVLVLITHLFKEQTWTEDTLKIIIGVLIGASSSKLTKIKKQDEITNQLNIKRNKIQNSIVNQALGDIKQSIENFKSDVSKIENAIINQYSFIENKLDLINQTSFSPQIKKNESFELETDDEYFLEKLTNIQHSGNGHTWNWIEECIKYPDFSRRINEKIEELKSDGWTVISMRFDNIGRGIYINFEIVKSFK